MTLDDILNTVLGGDPDQWEYIADWYRAPDGASRERAVFRPDVTLSLEWGPTVVDPFSEPWTEHFPHRHAASIHVDILYNGVLVFRDHLVSVDGGRCVLPQPRLGTDGSYVATMRQEALARTVHGLSGGSYDFDEYMRRSGIVAV